MTTITVPNTHRYEEFPSIREFLAREPLVYLSGGIGSQLALHDLPSHDAGGLPTVASLHAPEILTEIHAQYADAGASILTVDTFDLSPWRQRKHDADNGAERAASGVRAAYDAARAVQGRYPDRPLYLAGSLTSLEDCYDPAATPGTGVLARAHTDHVKLHADNGADLLCIETIPTVREAAVLASIADSYRTPFIVSFTAGEDGNPLDGHSIEDAERATRSGYRLGIGVNCCSIPAAFSAVERLNKTFEGRAGQHIAAYPNGYRHTRAQFTAQGGEDTDHKHDGSCEHAKLVFPAHEFAQVAHALRARGASLIGGCCGTSPAHTRAYTQHLGGRLSRRLVAA